MLMQLKMFSKESISGMGPITNIFMVEKLEYMLNGIVVCLTMRNIKCKDSCCQIYDFGCKSIMLMVSVLMVLLRSCINIMELGMVSQVSIVVILGNYHEYFN